MANLRSWAVFAFLLLLAPRLAAQDKYFDSDGVTVRYVVQGTGEPVVLVHGLDGNLETWVKRGILPDLARNYQVVAFDLRGHGKSGKPHDPKAYGREMALDIVRLLDHLGIARAHIVGFSLGSQLVSQLLTLRPDRFLTATLIAGAGRLEWTDEQARDSEQEAVERERECVSRTLLERQTPPGQPKPSEQQIAALSSACMADSTQDRFALAAAVRSRGDQLITPAAAAAVTVPTLAIVGSLDTNNRKGLEALKALRPALDLVIIDGATHTGDRGILGRPETMTALRKFLATNRVVRPF